MKRNVVIMKYMRNGDMMNEVITNGRMDARLVLRVVKDIVNCLVYLAQLGMHHGDVKP